MESNSGQPGWTPSDWLTYYSECRQFLLEMGQKFVSLVTQATVFAFAAVAAVQALREYAEAGLTPWQKLGIVLPAVAGLLFYRAMTATYFRQIQAVGAILAGLEQTQFPPAARPGLLMTLRQDRYAFFKKERNYWWTQIYFCALFLLVAASLFL